MPREGEQTITKVSTLTRKIILEDITKLCLKSDAIHMTRNDTMLENVLETKMSPTRRMETREDIMHMLQRMMNLPQRESYNKLMNPSSDEEYVLISTLTGNITHGSNDWLIDNGASKHMTGFKESFLNMSHLTR